MPKLAVHRTPSHPPLHPLRIRSRSQHRQPFASSHIRPLAQPRHDHALPLYTDPKPNPTPSRSPASAPSHVPLFFSPSPLNQTITDGPNRNNSDHKPPDERILKLGKTLRTLSPLLPTILTNPLPPHILSPSVTLHLFPSTHPHLPTVKGRTLYRAALWAVPVAWGGVPLVGNVKLQILSEKIVRAGTVPDPVRHGDGDTGAGEERLVVRWRTEAHNNTSTTTTNTSSTSTSTSGSPTSTSTPPQSSKEDERGTGSGINKGLSTLLGGDAPIFKLSHQDQFTGLFIFSFDEEGRVLTQTIEHAEDASGWERTSKFVTLTDWLIGKARGSLHPGGAGGNPAGLLGYQCHDSRRRSSHLGSGSGSDSPSASASASAWS